MNRLSYGALAIVFTIIGYFVTLNLYVSGLIFITYGLYFAWYLPKVMLKFINRQQRAHETYRFINSFIIAVSVKKTPNAALDSINGQLSQPLLKVIEQLDTSDTFIIIEHLKSYFNSMAYEMFTKILDLYITQGGSILKMSSLLLATMRTQETEIDEKMAIAKRKLTNFVILWALTLVVLLFSRFGISYLFEAMNETLIFSIGMSCYFLFLIYSVHIWVNRYIQIEFHV